MTIGHCHDLNFSLKVSKLDESRLKQNDFTQEHRWVMNSFLFNSIDEQYSDELDKMKSSIEMQEIFSDNNLYQFLGFAGEFCPSISIKARQVLVMFSTSYLCESGFSTMNLLKNKVRSCLNVKSALILIESHFK